MKKVFEIKGVHFDPVFVQSGTLNFGGEGWRYHKPLKVVLPERFDFSGTTDVSKTTTFAPRQGNMPLDGNLQPKELFPKCIYVDHAKGIALNAVGLSGPGMPALLERRILQNKTRPSIISIMAADGKTTNERLEETDRLGLVLAKAKGSFRAPFGVENNISCPNTDHDPAEKAKQEKALAEEVIEQGRILRHHLGSDAVQGIKINPLMTTRTALLIQDSGVYDYIMVSNTIPWLELPEWIDWRKLFGSETSPLIKRGLKQPGGLSGAPLLPIVMRWIIEARAAGITIPIIAGGGVLHPKDVDILYFAGATSISLGSVAFLKPHNVQPIIKRANQLFGGIYEY
ncbi:MAG: Dihydroorotate dehydrogenase family protein [Candidatus Moranbacteria bacterium GW2011_GWE1_49_15]|nr:MAG: Dihydroorotate dehydrogenase family protein [Candidatus Moranbacteria bacterium GW2011_GWE2_47_10]KKW05650.1 MAG: Dihydroorotate dehydrogenase family protein [Candidatus Moranbacteria bacterium GW2011_GWE1_49_15]